MPDLQSLTEQLRDVTADRDRYARKYALARRAKNKANQRTRLASLKARFWKEMAERYRKERDEARAVSPSLWARLCGLFRRGAA